MQLGALEKIKAIMEDDGLEDFACVGAILWIFEEMRCWIERRHDFG